jgi:HlyD family secretion protein
MKAGKLTLLSLALVFLSAGCADREAQKNAKTQADLLSDTTIPVTTVRPERRTVVETLSVSGSLDTLDMVQVGAKIGGRLTMVAVKEGSRVRAGQLIAQVETTDLQLQVQQAQAALQQALSRRAEAQIQVQTSPEQTDAAVKQAEAQLAAAKAQLEIVRKGARTQEREQARQRVNQAKAALDKARADLDRMRKLYEQEAISKADLDAVQAVHDQALAAYQQAVEAYDLVVEGARPEEIQQAEQAVRQAEEAVRIARSNRSLNQVRRQQLEQAEAAVRQAQAALRLAQAALADASIYAPLDGYVSGKPAQVGQVVGPGTPVATVVSLNGLYFDAQVSETDIARVQAGQVVTVRVDALPSREFVGRVVAINPVGAQLGRMFSVRVGLNDPEKLLRPGMFATGEIQVEQIPNSLVIPAAALIREGDKTFVWVRKGADGVEKIEIESFEAQDSMVRVQGLTGDEEVILEGKEKLLPDSKIRVVSTPEATQQ